MATGGLTRWETFFAHTLLATISNYTAKAMKKEAKQDEAIEIAVILADKAETVAEAREEE